MEDRTDNWEELVQSQENRLYRAALAILGSRQEAEDAVQDTFLAFWEKAPEGLRDEGAWLMRVLVNNCRSRLRTSRRRETLPLWEELPAPEPEERALWEELRALPPQDRAAIHLFYYEGFSTQEIARILKCRPGTVRSRLSRARERLRELLDPNRLIFHNREEYQHGILQIIF